MRNPVADSADDGQNPLVPRVDSLDGKRIGFYNNNKPAAEPVTEVLRTRMAERYPDATFERFHVAARDDEQLREIGEWAAEEVDVALAVIGDCGGCTRAIVRATEAIEAHGTPAVGIVAADFERAFEASAEDQRRPLRCQPVSIRSETTDTGVIEDAIDDDVLDGIEASLTEPLDSDERDGEI